MKAPGLLRADQIAGLEDSETREPKPAVLVVATEWFPVHGGLSVFNQWFCGWLSEKGFDVWCYLPHVDANNREHAREKRRCSLVAPVDHNRVRHLHRDAQLLAKPDLPQDVLPEIIFGHDRMTGIHARLLQDRYFPDAKVVQVIHLHPDDSQKYRTDRESAEPKGEAQEACVDGASLILAVGPKLGRHAERLARPSGTPVCVVVPDGSILEGACSGLAKAATGYVNFTGRLEDLEQKGLMLLGGAWSSLNKTLPGCRRAEIMIRGTDEQNPRQKSQLDDLFGGAKPICYPFKTDGAWRRKDLDGADLAVMPSLGEGFGLVALEAIYCKTPVLMNRDSGIADLLEAACPGCAAIVGDPSTESWRLAIERVLHNPFKHFEEAIELHANLLAHLDKQQYEAKALGAIRALV